MALTGEALCVPVTVRADGQLSPEAVGGTLAVRSVRLAALIADGFKSRLGYLCRLCPSRQRQPSLARAPVKGPRQTLARNESERDSAVQVGERAEHREARHRSLGRVWRRDDGNRDERDRVPSGR